MLINANTKKVKDSMDCMASPYPEVATLLCFSAPVTVQFMWNIKNSSMVEVFYYFPSPSSSAQDFCSWLRYKVLQKPSHSAFYVTQNSLQRSQQPATGPYEPYESRLHHLTLFP